jgi:hypothetical protein
MGQKSNEERFQFFETLKRKYKKLVFFDDLDGTEIQYFSYWHFFDLYFKKQTYLDKTLYLEKLVGNKLFTNHYHESHGITPELPSKYDGQFKGNSKELQKINLAWNISLGIYPTPNTKLVRLILSLFGVKGLSAYFSMHQFRRKGLEKNKIIKCQARFAYNPKRKHVDFQRKLFLDIIGQDPNFLAGKVSKKNYQQEIKQVSAVLSPFGYGEICFRDFEAIRNGCVLVKPDMSHVDTWPNVYRPFETYLPVDWSGNDILEKVDTLLGDKKMILDIALNGQSELLKSYENIDQKVREFTDIIYSLD